MYLLRRHLANGFEDYENIGGSNWLATLDFIHTKCQGFKICGSKRSPVASQYWPACLALSKDTSFCRSHHPVKSRGRARPCLYMCCQAGMEPVGLGRLYWPLRRGETSLCDAPVSGFVAV